MAAAPPVLISFCTESIIEACKPDSIAVNWSLVIVTIGGPLIASAVASPPSVPPTIAELARVDGLVDTVQRSTLPCRGTYTIITFVSGTRE